MLEMVEIVIFYVKDMQFLKVIFVTMIIYQDMITRVIYKHELTYLVMESTFLKKMPSSLAW